MTSNSSYHVITSDNPIRMETSELPPTDTTSNLSAIAEEATTNLLSSQDGTSVPLLHPTQTFCHALDVVSHLVLACLLSILSANGIGLTSPDEQYRNFKALVKDLANESEDAQREVLDSLLQVLLLPSTLYIARYWKLLFDVYALVPPSKDIPALGEEVVSDLGHQLAHQAFHPQSSSLWSRYIASNEKNAEDLIQALEALVSVPINSEALLTESLKQVDALNLSETDDIALIERKKAVESKLASLSERNDADSASWLDILSELRKLLDSYPIPNMTQEGSEEDLERITLGEIRIEVSNDSNKFVEQLMALRQRATELWHSRMPEGSQDRIKSLGLDAGLYLLHRALGEAFERKFLVLARQLAFTLIPLLASSYRELVPINPGSPTTSDHGASSMAKLLIDLRVVLESVLAPWETHSEDNALIVAMITSECYGRDFDAMETKDQAAAVARASLFDFMTAVSRAAHALPSPDIVRYVVHLGILSTPTGESTEKQESDGDFFVWLCLQEWQQALTVARSDAQSGVPTDLILEFLRLYQVHIDLHTDRILRPGTSSTLKIESLKRLIEVIGTIKAAPELVLQSSTLADSLDAKLEPSLKDDADSQASWNQLHDCIESLQSQAAELALAPPRTPSNGSAAAPQQGSSSSPSSASASTLDLTQDLDDEGLEIVNSKKRSRDQVLVSSADDTHLEPASKLSKLQEGTTEESSTDSKADHPPSKYTGPGPIWAPRPPHQPQLPQHDGSFRLSAALVNALIPSQNALNDVSANKAADSTSETNSSPQSPTSTANPKLDASTELEELEEAQRRLLQKKKQLPDSEIKFSPFLLTNLNAPQRTKLSQLLQKDELYGLVKHLEESQTKAEMELERERTILQSLHAQRRVDLTKKHQVRSHSVPITSDAHLQAIVAQNGQELSQLESELSLELSAFQSKRSDVLEEKLRNQQQVLHAFGVPGFTATKDEQALALQRAILELIVAESAKRPKPVAASKPAKPAATSLFPASTNGTGTASSAPGSVAITYENADARQSMLQHHLELLKAQHTASKGQNNAARPPTLTSPVRPLRTYPYTSPFRNNAAPFSAHPAAAASLQAYSNYGQAKPPTHPNAPSYQHPYQQSAPTMHNAQSNAIDQQYARLEALKQKILRSRAPPTSAASSGYSTPYYPSTPSMAAPSQAEVLQDLNRQLAAVEQRDRFPAAQPAPAQAPIHTAPPATNGYYHQPQAAHMLTTHPQYARAPSANAYAAPPPAQPSYYPYATQQQQYQAPQYQQQHAAPPRAQYYAPQQAPVSHYQAPAASHYAPPAPYNYPNAPAAYGQHAPQPYPPQYPPYQTNQAPHQQPYQYPQQQQQHPQHQHQHQQQHPQQQRYPPPY